jgi:purine-binding chemotaxis protein CheW
MLTYTPTPLPPLDRTTDSLPVLLFSVGRTILGIPLADVVRILNAPNALQPVEAFQAKTQAVSLLHWGDQEVTLLNLYQCFFPNLTPLPPTPFLVIWQTKPGELYGIPVSEPPLLLNIPLTTIRPLPSGYRQALPLDIASYVAVLPRADHPVSIFLLDLRRILAGVLTQLSQASEPMR